jgi:hypothetical protein
MGGIRNLEHRAAERGITSPVDTKPVLLSYVHIRAGGKEKKEEMKESHNNRMTKKMIEVSPKG